MASILIVDDATIMRKNLKTILTEAGHNIVAEASNGSQAYVEYVKHKPDLVTMDITMPYMNGVDTLKKIIQDYPEAKIIIISSTNNNKVILEAIQSGAKNYIIKPFLVDKVLEVINQVLQIEDNVSSETIDKIYKTMEAGQPDISAATSLPKEITARLSLQKNISEADVKGFKIQLKNNTFIISFEQMPDSDSFNRLIGAIQGFLLVKPLKLVFDFASLMPPQNEYVASLCSFFNKAVKLGGSVLVVTQERTLVQAFKDIHVDPAVSFYSTLSDLH